MQLPDTIVRDWKGLQRIVEALLGKPEIRRGVQVVNFSASVFAEATVSHGLGKTPVIAGGWALSNGSTVYAVFVHSLTKDSFVLRAVTSPATTGPLTIMWIAAD